MAPISHAARKQRVLSLAAETLFELRIMQASLPSIDASTHKLELEDLEKDLLLTKSKLSAFFKSTARQRRHDALPVRLLIPQSKDRRP